MLFCNQIQNSQSTFYSLQLIQLVHVGPDELKFAQNALFSRHPVMKTWPKDHGEFPSYEDSKSIGLIYKAVL